MQSSAGTELPHTRAGAVHWLTVAVALAAVWGVAAVLQPPEAAAGSGAAPAPGAGGPDPARALYPMDCGPWPTQVVHQAAEDFDGDGRPETVAVVRCRSGSGTPPSGIYVLAAGPGARSAAPRIAETLLDPAEQLSVKDFAIRGRSISVKLLGYSSPEVPRCCPDQERKVTWIWERNGFGLRAAPAPGSV